jgi:hypothetical protein
MPGLKNSKPGTLINISEFNKRTFSTTDAAYDFYTKSLYYHGILYGGIAAGTTTFSMSSPMHVGPCNEITLQVVGTAGNIATPGIIKGSLDGINFVNVNLVSSADGFIRIQSKYRYLNIAEVTGLDTTSGLYLMLS